MDTVIKILSEELERFKHLNSHGEDLQIGNYENEISEIKQALKLLKMKKETPLMTSNCIKAKCPKCGALEIDAATPFTVYGCGSKDYDQRPNTFIQSDECVTQ